MMFLDSIDSCAMSRVAATFTPGYLPFVCWPEHQPPVSSCSACGESRPPRSIYSALCESATLSRIKLRELRRVVKRAWLAMVDLTLLKKLKSRAARVAGGDA